MLRSRGSSEEWERKKSYLIRSLFKDTPDLSPILEEHELESSPTPSNFRPESPLPDLIIEIEPRKPNPHDDPEEVYEKLAKEIRRLYKRDFLGIDESTSSSDINNSQDINGLACGSVFDDPGSDNESVEDESWITDSHQSYTDDIEASRSQTEKSTSSKSSESIHVATETVLAGEDVPQGECDELQDEIEGENLNLKRHPLHTMEEDSPNVSKITSLIESPGGRDEYADVEEESGSTEIDANTDASTRVSSPQTSLDHSHASPEIMRQRRCLTSLGTPPDKSHSKSVSSGDEALDFNMELHLTEYSDDADLAAGRELDETERSPSNGINLCMTSTPRRKRKSDVIKTTERSSKRRSMSTSSCPSDASAANAALQTSFSDCEPDLSFFWSNFFVGVPTVYNFCSCDNHVCN